jgi:hypothetical protein
MITDIIDLITFTTLPKQYIYPLQEKQLSSRVKQVIVSLAMRPNFEEIYYSEEPHQTTLYIRMGLSPVSKEDQPEDIFYVFILAHTDFKEL